MFRKFRSPDFFPPRQVAANRLIWMVLIISAGFDLTIINFLDLKLVVAYAPMFTYIFAVCALISLTYRYIVHERSLFMFGEVVAQMICSSFVIMVTILLGARMNLPLIDESLLRIDRFLGFDWYEHATWLNAQAAWLNEFLKFCYQSYGMQAFILLPALFIRGHSDQAQRFVMVFFITGMIAAIIGSFLPAEAMYVYFHANPADYPNISPAAPLLHEPELLAMRNHTTSVLVYPGMGLLTFPSFHTTMAIMLIYAAVPMPWMLPLAIVINVGMIFATPFHGGHYIIDVMAGYVIGFFGIWCAEKILPPRSQALGKFLNQMGAETESTPPS